MKLSDGEKLGLFMLAEVYEHLGVNGDIEPKFVKDAISSGHAWAVKERYSGIFNDSGSDEIAHQVSRILGMWRMIEESYAKLDQSEKTRLASLVPHLGENPRFEGFDGNAGDGFYGTAEFLVNKADMGWDDFQGRPLNSHGSATTAGHLRMLEVYSERAGNLHRGGFTVEDLAAVLQARAHPDR